MAELKTKPTSKSAEDYLSTIVPEQKRNEGFVLLKLFQDITGEKAVMWGASIVGFGSYHYKSERSRQEGDWPLVGFSPRKQNLTLYLLLNNKKNAVLLEKLGKHKMGVGCLYINKLTDVNLPVLKKLIKESYDIMKKTTKPA